MVQTLKKVWFFFTDKEPTTVRQRKILSTVLFGILLCIAVVILPWKEILRILIQAELQYIIAAFLLLFPSLLLNAWSYRIILSRQAINLSTWRILAINLSISFYEIVLPSTLVGSGLRWYRYARDSSKPVESLAAITYYKIFTIFLVLLLSLGFLLLTGMQGLGGDTLQVGVLFTAVSALLLLLPRLSKQLLTWLDGKENNQNPSKVQIWVKKPLGKFLQAFADFGQLRFKHQGALIALGLTSQMVQMTAYLAMARGVGIDLSFTEVGALRTLTLLAANLPLNFSPGIGLREVSLAALLAAMGIPLEYAGAMTMVAFARVIFNGMLGGIIEALSLFKKHRSV